MRETIGDRRVALLEWQLVEIAAHEPLRQRDVEPAFPIAPGHVTIFSRLQSATDFGPDQDLGLGSRGDDRRLDVRAQRPLGIPPRVSRVPEVLAIQHPLAQHLQLGLAARHGLGGRRGQLRHVTTFTVIQRQMHQIGLILHQRPIGFTQREQLAGVLEKRADARLHRTPRSRQLPSRLQTASHRYHAPSNSPVGEYSRYSPHRHGDRGS